MDYTTETREQFDSIEHVNEAIFEVARRGKKIEAIKLFRVVNEGLTLLEAKNAVEAGMEDLYDLSVEQLITRVKEARGQLRGAQSDLIRERSLTEFWHKNYERQGASIRELEDRVAQRDEQITRLRERIDVWEPDEPLLEDFEDDEAA